MYIEGVNQYDLSQPSGNLQFEMEGVSYVEELLYNIRFDLCNIETLNPGDFVQQLLCFPLVGLEESVMMVLREVIRQFQNERAIMKYIYIIDKLIKVTEFIPAIQNAIIDIYSETFLFLLQQKCNTEIEQLKILRKFWVGKLHPYCLAQIKDIIIQKTNIDIDCGFKPETINTIRNYYKSKLNMSAEEMAKHLPLLRKSEDRYVANSMNNQRYMVEATSLYPNSNSYQTSSLIPSTLSNISNISNINNISNVNSSYPYTIPPYQPQPLYTPIYPPALHLQNSRGAYSRMGPQISNQMQDVKRKRLASQQTRAALPGAMFEGVQPNPRKLQHKIEVIIDYKFMLSKLKQMNPFSCKECGLQFMTSETHENHRGDHFKQKLSKTEKNARVGKSSKLCSVQDWLGKSDLDFSLDQFYISIPKQEIQARLCDFCCAPLDIDFRSNQWIYANAALVTLNSQLATVHKSCQLALEAEQEHD